MPAFDTGDALIPYPSLPGVFKGQIILNRPVYVTDVTTIPMKGTKGQVKSYKFTDPATGIPTDDLSEGRLYNIEIKLDSYPHYFHNVQEIETTYGLLTHTSFKDINGRGRMWIPTLEIEGDPAMDKWVPLMSAESAVCMVDMPTDAKANIELRNAEIWIDGIYIHRHAPGDVYFCEGCMCGEYIDCGFGEHTVTIVKKGYNNFEQVITPQEGDLINISPLMTRGAATKTSLNSTLNGQLTSLPKRVRETPTASPPKQRNAIVSISLSK
jgi:hypothetical protein